MEKTRNKHLLNIMIALAEAYKGIKEELRRGQENVYPL